MPRAYRGKPSGPDEQHLHIIAVYTEDGWRFQEMWSHVFGIAAAVVNFNRRPRFIQAAVHRLRCAPYSMYFDNGSIVDL